MKREDLARLDPREIRKDAKKFSLFKQYVTEDASFVFPSGKLPQGCFGCQFLSNFSKWKNYVLKPKTKQGMSKNKSYKLQNDKFIVYFKGRVLDKNSTDEDWEDWINYPNTPEKIQDRKRYFNKLPDSYTVEVKDEKPTVKKRVKKEKTEEKKEEEE